MGKQPGGEQMTSKASEYRIADRAEHGDEQLHHQSEPRAEHPNSAYQAANQHLVKDGDELKSVNEQVSLEFQQRKNPAEYDPSERKTVVGAVEQAFNQTDWNGKEERRIAAEDIAQNLFQPMYRRMELAAAAAEYKLRDEFIEELRREQVEHLKERDDGTGRVVLEIGLKDIETAQRLAEHSNGAFHVVSTWQLDNYRDQFADALYDSGEHPEESRQAMEDALGQAVAYYNGEIPRKPELVEEHRGEVNLAAAEPEEGAKHAEASEAVEHGEAGEEERTEFEKLEGMNEGNLAEHIEGTLDEKLQHTWTLATAWQTEGHPDAAAAFQVHEALYDMSYDGIESSIDGGNAESYTKIMEGLQERDEQLREQMEAGEGFIDIEGYFRPALPEQFGNLEEAREYAEKMRANLERYQEDISAAHYQIVNHMLEQLEHGTEFGAPGMKPADLGEDLRGLHGIAGGIDYAMRAEDPVYWELHGLDSDARQERLKAMGEDQLKAAQAEGYREILQLDQGQWEDKIAEEKLLRECLAENLDDLLSRAEHNLEIMTAGSGQSPDTTFGETHRAFLNNVEYVPEYFRTFREGNMLEIEGAPEPLEMASFDADEEPLSSPARFNYLHGPAESYRQNFRQIHDEAIYRRFGNEKPLTGEDFRYIGDGVEVTPEKTRLLYHLVTRFGETLDHAQEHPEGLENAMPKLVEYSKVMTNLVKKKEPAPDTD